MIEQVRTIAVPLPTVPERLIQRREVAAEAEGASHLRQSFEAVEQIVDDAMAFSGINPETAPVRWESARKAATYATYVALGLTRDTATRQAVHELASGGDKEWLAREMQVDYIARFEGSISQSRIGEE